MAGQACDAGGWLHLCRGLRRSLEPCLRDARYLLCWCPNPFFREVVRAVRPHFRAAIRLDLSQRPATSLANMLTCVCVCVYTQVKRANGVDLLCLGSCWRAARAGTWGDTCRKTSKETGPRRVIPRSKSCRCAKTTGGSVIIMTWESNWVLVCLFSLGFRV